MKSDGVEGVALTWRERWYLVVLVVTRLPLCVLVDFFTLGQAEFTRNLWRNVVTMRSLFLRMREIENWMEAFAKRIGKSLKDLQELSDKVKEVVREQHDDRQVHITKYAGRLIVVYNPLDLPISELPIIYGFNNNNNNNGGTSEWYEALLIAEDGEILGRHICSHEDYMSADLGVLEGARPDRHERFREKYPDGYRMTFIPYDKVGNHEGLQKALAKSNRHRITTIRR